MPALGDSLALLASECGKSVIRKLANGTFATRAAAEKHERAVQFFKRR